MRRIRRIVAIKRREARRVAARARRAGGQVALRAVQAAPDDIREVVHGRAWETRPPSSLVRPAAVDEMNRARRERRFVRREIERQAGRSLRAGPGVRAAVGRRTPPRLPRRCDSCAPLRPVFCSLSDGDSTVPGQIALQRMPLPMKSSATDLVRPTYRRLARPCRRSGSARRAHSTRSTTC